MEILIKSVEIVDRRSPLNSKRRNILVKNGIIEKISASSIPCKRVLDARGMKVSLGWFDMRAHFCDPGLESREDLESGRAAATAGGFTDVLLQPNTKPVVASKNEVSYLLKGNATNLTQLHVAAAVTTETKGTELTEMIDLHHAGALAFTDGYKPLWHTDVFGKALQYLHKMDSLLINRAEDQMLSAHGQMNEGLNSTLLGMPGIPTLAEELMVARDLALLEYHGGRLHFANVSSIQSLQLIKAAKKRGLAVSCDVAAHQLLYHDGLLNEFDTNYKVNPPLRDIGTRKALLKALGDGTIDVLVSDHRPQDEEGKKLEFDLASFGMINIQEMPAAVVQLSNDIETARLVEAMTYAPRNLLGIAQPKIAVGNKAVLTVFDQSAWELNDQTNCSRSRNSPSYGKTLMGKARAVFNGTHTWIDTGINLTSS